MPEEAVIYARASKDRTGAGLSVAGQESDCRDFARQHGLTVRQVYADNDLTASGTKIRPAYRQMLADLASRPATVVVWHTDRLHRHLAELEEYIALAEDHAVITRAVRAGDLDLATPSGRMVARMLGVVARHELEQMSDRRKAGKARAATAGEWKGGRRPFGYASNGVTVIPAEAEAIAAASADILVGVSLAAVTRRWNNGGVRTSTGGRWMPREVSRVLRRPRNAGLMEHREQVIGEAEWDAIVDETTWRGVCAVLGDPQRRTSPGPGRRWLLSGIAICGVCGAPAIVQGMGGKGRPMRPVYRDRPVGAPRHVARDVANLDAYVIEAVKARFSRADAAPGLRPAVSLDDAARLHARMAVVRQRLDQAAELFSAGEIDARQFALSTQALRADQDAIGAKLAALARRDALSGFRGRDFTEVWEGLDVGQRRAVIQQFIREVVIYPTPRGRPPGWSGGPYFWPDSIKIGWHGSPLPELLGSPPASPVGRQVS
jgi:site-specific DNA recombinase